MTFVPEFYNPSHVNSTEIGFAQPYANTAGWVLLYNEPYGQGGLTTDNAIAVHAAVQAMGVRIVAPSIGWCTGSCAAKTWWQDFDTKIQANGYHYDALNFHCVAGTRTGNGNPAGLGTTCITNLDSFHAAYPQYEVWATEVELLTTPDAAGRAEIQKFYGVLIPALEARPWVTHYAGWPATLDGEGSGGTGTPDVNAAMSFADTSGVLTTTGTYWTQLSPHQ